MRWEARGCILHYNSFPHTCNLGLTHPSYWMLHQRQGPSYRNPGEYLDRMAPASKVLGQFTRDSPGDRHAAGSASGRWPSSASFSCPFQPPHPGSCTNLENDRRELSSLNYAALILEISEIFPKCPAPPLRTLVYRQLNWGSARP